jgi:predicted Zn-dependent protease
MRKTIVILSTCIALLLFGYVSYRGYEVWKQSHGISMAKTYLAKGDLRTAMLALQQVIETNPRNLEGSRMMAQVLEAQNSPNTLSTALQWRQHVIEIDPSNEDRLALAQTAILAKDYLTASNALASVEDAGKKTAAYHNLAGMAAIIAGKLTEAEEHFSEAIRIDPSDQPAQMNLAVIRLNYTNALDMAEARISLQRLAGSTNGTLCVQALRVLIADAFRFTNSSTALEYSKELLQQTNSIYTDKLLRLDVLRRFAKSEFTPTFAAYKADAVNDPVKAADLATWQMVNFPETNALVWMRQLPIEVRTNQALDVLTAECLLRLRDWRGLQAAIQQQKWDEPANNLEYLRHAYMARSLREQELSAAATAEWAVAIKSVNELRSMGGRKGAYRKLFDQALKWKWNDEAEQILWTILNEHPDEKWVFPVLRNYFIIQNRTPKLLRLFETMHRQLPNDLEMENNLAAIALLLGDQASKPYDLAKEVYQKDPKNQYFASTYAFALYKQGKYADALNVMQQLNLTALQEPSIAGYYGVILEANGNKADAKTYLNLASKAPALREEQALFDQARAGL